MFSALETTWDQSARRRWTTVASFTMQALGLTSLLAIPLFIVQGPPKVEWIASRAFAPPSDSDRPVSRDIPRATHPSNMSGIHLRQPSMIPNSIGGKGSHSHYESV